MHMANELLSVPVAGGTVAIAAVGLGLICRKASQVVTSQRLALMGILGAFVFAAQMVQYPLPLMPGTSGHLVGAVLLSIVLGPCAGCLVISSVIIVQCLIFQDGGILALGCNIINMGLVPCFVGWFIYRLAAGQRPGKTRMYIACVGAAVPTVVLGATLVVVQAAISGVVTVPISTFMITMVGVHTVIGLMEGLITAAVIMYLRQVRPDVFDGLTAERRSFAMPLLYATLVVATVVTAAGLSLLASSSPDGLEWSYMERPNQEEFKPMVHNDSTIMAKIDDLHSKYAPLPDYTIKAEAASAGWTSFAGVAGSAVTMGLILLVGRVLKRKADQPDAPCTA